MSVSKSLFCSTVRISIGYATGLRIFRHGLVEPQYRPYRKVRIPMAYLYFSIVPTAILFGYVFPDLNMYCSTASAIMTPRSTEVLCSPVIRSAVR